MDNSSEYRRNIFQWIFYIKIYISIFRGKYPYRAVGDECLWCTHLNVNQTIFSIKVGRMNGKNQRNLGKESCPIFFFNNLFYMVPSKTIVNLEQFCPQTDAYQCQMYDYRWIIAQSKLIIHYYWTWAKIVFLSKKKTKKS